MILFRTTRQKDLENELESTKQQISTLQSKNNVSDINPICMLDLSFGAGNFFMKMSSIYSFSRVQIKR